MYRTITLRLSEEEYKEISAVAEIEHRPISNFITTKVLEDIEESYYADPIEMAQIKSDKKLLKRLETGHRHTKKMKGRFVG